MVPLVETAEDVAAVVAACRLPPLGVRGTAPGNVRAARYGYDKDRFIAEKGRDVFVMTQVETAATVANLHEIVKVEGIDMLFIGRNDLASSIGRLDDQNGPESRELLAEAERRIREAGRWLGGIPAPDDSAAAMFERGYDMVIATADHALLRDGALAVVASFRKSLMATFAPVLRAAVLRAGGPERLEARLAVPATRDQLVARGDDRYLSQMCLRIFRAGLKHALVDAKWPAFEDAFHRFSPVRVSRLRDEDLEACMSNRALIRHWGKIRAVRANAAAMRAVVAEHGSFGRWLADWPRDDIVGLWERLAADFSQLGGNSGPYFLRAVGKDTFVLTDHVVRGLVANGIATRKPTGKRDRRTVQTAFNAWAAETGRPLCQLSQILALSDD